MAKPLPGPREDASLLEMAVVPLFAPARAAAQVGRHGAHALAWGMLLTMALATALNALNLMYHHAPGALLPLPAEASLDAWRFWQRFWFPPYAVLVVAAAAALLSWDSPRLAGRALDFRSLFQAMAMAGFAPWLVVQPLVAVLIPSDLGGPAVLVPLHLAALGWSGFILATVLRQGCGLPPGGAKAVAATSFVLVAALLGMAVR